MDIYKSNAINLLGKCFRLVCVMLVISMVPAVTFSQGTAPPLGTAANFGILAQAAISGTSVVVGNVGTLSGTIDVTITAPGYTVYPVNDAVVQTANANLLTAYNDAAGQNPFITLPGGILTGTLTAGVYRLSAATPNLTGTITLDGGGVFILQASSTLITSDGSSVLLTNGTVWSNVYWQVGSSATLGANSTFMGTILANTSITVGASASVTGRMLAGAVTATGAVSLGSNVLPVELTSFTATLNNNAVKLNWNTATEVNNYGFNVERRVKNAEWTKIGFVKGHGNSNSPKEYSFEDKNPQTGKIQYRLEQIDFDGTFEYSNIVGVEVEAPEKFTVYQNYPNPFNPTTNISYEIPMKSNVVIKIYNVLGSEVVGLLDEEKLPGRYQIQFKASNIPSGIYFYSINAGQYKSIMKMILLK